MRMCMTWSAAAWRALLLTPLLVRPLAAQQAPALPAGAEALKIVVESASGKVRYRRDGQVFGLTSTSELRPGDTVVVEEGGVCKLEFQHPTSGAVLSAVILRDYTEMTVAEAYQQGEQSRTQLDIPQGDIRAGVVRTAVPPPFRVHDPQEPEPPSYAIARRGTATVEDGYRTFVATAVEQGRIKLDGSRTVERLSYDELAAQLRTLGVIDPHWEYAAHDCLRRDVVAYMACSYMGCRPGLVTGVFGMTRRYAHREMLYRQIIAPGAPGTLVSGSELLSVAGRVAKRTNPHHEVQLTKDEIH